MKSFLVDGFTAGFRKIIEGKKRPTLVLEPFGRLIRTDKAALAVKGEALLRFATDAETHDVEFVHTD